MDDNLVYNKEKLLHIGLRGVREDTIKGRKKYIMEAMILLFIAIFFLIAVVVMGGTIAGSEICALLLFLSIVLLLIWGLNRILGGEIDGIYENGLTHRYTTFIDRLKGENFHYYHDIVKIRYGVTKSAKGITNYVRFLKKGKFRYSPYFCENLYINDYYNNLIEILKVKCPNAKWKRLDEI